MCAFIADACVLSCSLQQYIDEQNQEFETACANFEVCLIDAGFIAVPAWCLLSLVTQLLLPNVFHN